MAVPVSFFATAIWALLRPQEAAPRKRPKGKPLTIGEYAQQWDDSVRPRIKADLTAYDLELDNPHEQVQSRPEWDYIDYPAPVQRAKEQSIRHEARMRTADMVKHFKQQFKEKEEAEKAAASGREHKPRKEATSNNIEAAEEVRDKPERKSRGRRR